MAIISHNALPCPLLIHGEQGLYEFLFCHLQEGHETEIMDQVGEDDLTIQQGINFTILKQDKVVALKNQFHHLELRSS